jgi:hypothetical protein
MDKGDNTKLINFNSQQIENFQNLLERDYNKPFPKYLKNIAYQGTIFAALGAYTTYLWGTKLSYGIIFGYAMVAGYNHRYLKEYIKNN